MHYFLAPRSHATNGVIKIIATTDGLIELLTEEHELRSGKFTQSFTKQFADAKWNSIANKLNSISGGKKNTQEWKRAWADLKTKTKGKNFQIKKYSNKTGGGPSCSNHLNETDDKMLSLINPTTLTGHIGVAESNVHFSFSGESNFETIAADKIAIEGNEIRIEDNRTIIDDNEFTIEDYELYINSQNIEPIDNNFKIITMQNMSTLPFEQENRLSKYHT
ncbi:Uncharacterized protein FWK35_00022968 [Aphis craccivora]|uniref:Regulatory protein zeste n=1 Tax=Aphis craccivora TaxID=307492 RepID=A0A6G0Y6G9_APHCR|nr:Uncharacterized protein FWK35_00022968 [Aphis craccivora]